MLLSLLFDGFFCYCCYQRVEVPSSDSELEIDIAIPCNICKFFEKEMVVVVIIVSLFFLLMLLTTRPNPRPQLEVGSVFFLGVSNFCNSLKKIDHYCCHCCLIVFLTAATNILFGPRILARIPELSWKCVIVVVVNRFEEVITTVVQLSLFLDFFFSDCCY